MFKNEFLNPPYFMKLNNIDFDKLSDAELKGLCLKYKLVDPQKIHIYQRQQLFKLLKTG